MTEEKKDMKQKILDVIAEVNKDIILYNGDNLFDA